MIRHRYVLSSSGASAAEFALVLPVLILLIFAVIDGGRWLWTYNRIEKATQMGARFAAVSDFASSQVGISYVGTTCGSTTLTQGDAIPSSCFTAISCIKPANTVTCSSGTANSTAFDNIVTRMRLFAGDVSAANVKVEYLSSGLGFAGTPNAPDASPIVRVSVNDPTTVATAPLLFRPLSYLTFKQSGITMPAIRASLTAEDMTGSQSN